VSNTLAYSKQLQSKKRFYNIDLRLRRISVAALFILVVFCYLSMLITAMLCGYPKVKFIYMTNPQKVLCIAVILFNLGSMVSASCFCYFQILRKRGQFGNNSVGVINDAVVNLATPGVNHIKLYFFVTDAPYK